MFRYFIRLFMRPKDTIESIVNTKITYKRIIIFLFWIGLARGIYEVIRPYVAANALNQLLLSLKIPSWYIIESVPFLISCIITAHIRWVMFAFVAFVIAKFFRGQGKFDDYLKLYGVILGLYLISPIFNSLYFITSAPAVEFAGSARYSSIIGLGQFVGAGLLLFITYKVIRHVGKLGAIESFFIGLFLPLLDRGLYIAFYKAFFSIDFITAFEIRKIFLVASIFFIIGGLFSIPILMRIGKCLNQRGKI